MNEQQKLIDITFGMIMTMHDKAHRHIFNKMSQEELAAWVRKQLSGCGFETTQVGSSWGVLKK